MEGAIPSGVAGRLQPEPRRDEGDELEPHSSEPPLRRTALFTGRFAADGSGDATGDTSPSLVNGRGLCPMPDGERGKPRASSSEERTPTTVRTTASSTWDQGLTGACMRRRKSACIF